MSSPEFPDILETQAEVCFELADKLKHRMVALRGTELVIMKREKIGGKLAKRLGKKWLESEETNLYLPFNVTLDTESGREFTWLAAVHGEDSDLMIEYSAVSLHRAPLDVLGNIQFDDKDLMYQISSRNRRLSCQELGFQRLRNKEINRKEGRIDLDVLLQPNAEEATNVRLLLEYALEQAS